MILNYTKKIISRLKTGTLKVKWLEELEQKEELGAIIRFTERYINKYYTIITGRFFYKRLTYNYYAGLLKIIQLIK